MHMTVEATDWCANFINLKTFMSFKCNYFFLISFVVELSSLVEYFPHLNWNISKKSALKPFLSVLTVNLKVPVLLFRQIINCLLGTSLLLLTCYLTLQRFSKATRRTFFFLTQHRTKITLLMMEEREINMQMFSTRNRFTIKLEVY